VVKKDVSGAKERGAGLGTVQEGKREPKGVVDAEEVLVRRDGAALPRTTVRRKFRGKGTQRQEGRTNSNSQLLAGRGAVGSGHYLIKERETQDLLALISEGRDLSHYKNRFPFWEKEVHAVRAFPGS